MYYPVNISAWNIPAACLRVIWPGGHTPWDCKKLPFGTPIGFDNIPPSYHENCTYNP